MPQFLHYHLYIYIDFLSSLLQCHGCNFSFLPHLCLTPLCFFSLSVSDICSSLPFTVLWSVLIIYLFAHPTPAHVCMCLCSDNKEAGWSKLAIWPNQPTLIKKLPLTHANTYTHTHRHTLLQWAMATETHHIYCCLFLNTWLHPHLIIVQSNGRIWSFTVSFNISGLFFTVIFLTSSLFYLYFLS